MKDLTEIVEEMHGFVGEGFQKRIEAGKVKGNQKLTLYSNAVNSYLNSLKLFDDVVKNLSGDNSSINTSTITREIFISAGLQDDEVSKIPFIADTISEENYVSLEDALFVTMANYVDVTRLAGKEHIAKAAKDVAIGIANITGRETIGLAMVYNEAGLLDNALGNNQESLQSYNRANQILLNILDRDPKNKRAEKALFRNAVVTTGAYLGGIRNGTFPLERREELTKKFHKFNDLREQMANNFGNTSMYGLAARARGELMSYQGNESKDTSLIDSAIKQFEVASERYGEENKQSWAGVVLDLHKAEALAHKVKISSQSEGYESTISELQNVFDSVLSRNEFIPPHSLKSVNGKRFNYIAETLDSIGKTHENNSYQTAITNMLS